jgi:hypothetical protein
MAMMIKTLMVKTTIELPDEIDKKFRKVVAEKKGLHKGVLGKALEEAIKDWIKANEK